MVSGDGEVAQATRRGAGLPLVAMARREGYGVELLELERLRVGGGTPARVWRRSGEGELGVSAKIGRGQAPLLIGVAGCERKEGEREIGSGWICSGEKERERRRKEGEGDGGFGRAVGPSVRERKKTRGESVGRSEDDSDLIRIGSGRLLFRLGPIYFLIKTNFPILLKQRRKSRFGKSKQIQT